MNYSTENRRKQKKLDSFNFLNQIENSNKEISKQLEKVQELKYKCLISRAGTAERVQTSKNVHSFEDKIIKLSQAKEALEALKADREQKRHEIITAIQQLEEPQDIEILYLRYVKGLKFKEIAKQLEYNYTWLIRLHKQALQHFTRLYNANHERG